MGWISEDSTHEGYLVGLAPCERTGQFVGHVQGRWRELGGRDEKAQSLRNVKIACSCGWRSPLISAPIGCEFFPCFVSAPEWFETEAVKVWERHVRETGTAHDGGCTIHQLESSRRNIR